MWPSFLFFSFCMHSKPEATLKANLFRDSFVLIVPTYIYVNILLIFKCIQRYNIKHKWDHRLVFQNSCRQLSTWLKTLSSCGSKACAKLISSSFYEICHISCVGKSDSNEHELSSCWQEMDVDFFFSISHQWLFFFSYFSPLVDGNSPRHTKQKITRAVTCWPLCTTKQK